jgi:hypothetical protein
VYPGEPRRRPRRRDVHQPRRTQRDQIKAYARAHGHRIVGWQEDLDKPGSTLNRPGLQAALQAIDAGEADGLIAAKLDRVTRSIADLGKLLHRPPTEAGTSSPSTSASTSAPQTGSSSPTSSARSRNGSSTGAGRTGRTHGRAPSRVASTSPPAPRPATAAAPTGSSRRTRPPPLRSGSSSSAAAKATAGPPSRTSSPPRRAHPVRQRDLDARGGQQDDPQPRLPRRGPLRRIRPQRRPPGARRRRAVAERADAAARPDRPHRRTRAAVRARPVRILPVRREGRLDARP